VGQGMSSATLERSDHELVAAVRGGDERAFEALYERYRRRIQAFVAGMVKDHARAEDITQEVFLSALRRMRATERPIAFKPWIYEIAKNACIDAFRRTRRAEEVSYDAADGLRPSDHRRLVAAELAPDAAVAAKQELETLCGAFGGLSDVQHEVLVMRELEGLSYQEIGDRMGMSRPAVESTLFRARRRLSEEYGELVSGERCRRVQGIITAATGGALGARDGRRLARHVAHCDPCRREALAAGLDRSLIARPPLRRRAAARIAVWLPFPALLRGRRGDGSAFTASGSGVAGHLPAISDQLSAGWPKLAAGVAMLAAGVGAGVGVRHQTADAQQTPRHLAAAAARHAAPATHPAAQRVAVGGGGHALRRSTSRTTSRAPRTTHTTAAAAPPAHSGHASTRSAAPTQTSAAAPSAPATTVRQGAHDTVRRAAGAVPAAGGAVNRAGQTVQSTVNHAGQTVQSTVNRAGQTVQSTVNHAGQTVQSTVNHAGQTVQSTVNQAGQTVQSTVSHAGQTVQSTASQAGQTVQSTVNQAGQTVNGAAGAATGVVGGLTGSLSGGH
jgi:RNA polymerase sigma factor (sigma-70 family)